MQNQFRMADFFLDSNEQGTAADPAADFLAGEQSDLAEIDGQVYDQVPVEGGFAEISPEITPPQIEEPLVEDIPHTITNNNNGICLLVLVFGDFFF